MLDASMILDQDLVKKYWIWGFRWKRKDRWWWNSV